MICSFPYALTAGFEPVFYDVNGDGLANTEDAIHIARHALQSSKPFPAEYLPDADLDSDGRITICGGDHRPQAHARALHKRSL